MQTHWICCSTTLAIVPAFAALAWLGSDHLGFDPTPYLTDLQALEDSTARGYANPEWQVQAGVVDPVVLHRRRESLIRVASSAREAERAAIAPNGDVWIHRLGHLTDSVATYDVLRAESWSVLASVSLPPRAQLVAIGERGVYTVVRDADDLQGLRLHAYPVLRKE